MPTYLSYKQGFTLHHVFSVGSGSERIGQKAAAVISLIMALGAALL